ncbi:MAG: 2-phosphosulfolactate phosphatase [Chthoniobacteraceae bacterium]
MNIDAILSPPEIDLLPQASLDGTVCVVFDILRATSSMVTGLAHGMAQILPVSTIEEALTLKTGIPDALLGGERFGNKIDGFDIGNSPLEYRDLAGHRVITTTTNGTVALRACEKAERVLVGAFLNMDALVARLRELSPEKIMLVCAGTFRELALEDVIAAGAVCANLPDAALGDAAMVAMSTFKRYENDLLSGLKESRNGRALIAAGRGGDVEWSAQQSIYDAVGEMKSGIITLAKTPDREP